MASPFAVPPLRRRAAVLAAWETITDVIADEGARARARGDEKTTSTKTGTRCVGCVESDLASVD